MIIDQLPEIDNVLTTDEMPIERGTTTYKTPVSKMPFVNKSGDTMTGALNIKSDSIIDGTAIQPSQSPSWGVNEIFRDSANNQIGIIHPLFRSNGQQAMSFRSRRANGGDAFLTIGKSANGDTFVEVDNDAAWRTALVLGNVAQDNIVSIAHGGTGASTASDALTALGAAAAANFGNTSEYKQILNNGGTFPVNVPSNTAGMIIVCGGTNMFDLILYKASLNGQTVYYERLINASNISVSTAANLITVTNNNASVLARGLAIKF